MIFRLLLVATMAAVTLTGAARAEVDAPQVRATVGGLQWRDRPPADLPASRCSDDTFRRLPDGFTSIRRPDLEQVSVNVHNLPTGVTAAAFVDAVEAAVRTWNDEVNDCGRPDGSDADFHVVGTVDTVPLPYHDGVHTVMFSEGQCQSVNAVACMYPHIDPSTGAAVGWDIVLERSYPWGIGAGPWLDVQNTVTHELGHVVGLDHVGTGLTEVTQARMTMYAYTWPGDVQKRTLALGDALGVEEVSREG